MNHLSTRLLHQPRVELARDNKSIVPPIHQSTKFYFESYAELENLYGGYRDGYLYSRVTNPTVAQLENLLAQLQGVESGVSVGSGVSAIFGTYMALLSKDDHVLLFYESYKPSRLLGAWLGKFGITRHMCSIHDHEQIEAIMRSHKPKLVVFESPTNPRLHIADIKTIVGLARQYGVTTMLDNTFAGFHNHHECGVDLYLHSLTKFANGVGDAFGGVLLGNEAIVSQMRESLVLFGSHLDAHAAARTLQGMKTYYVRYKKQCENAQKVAEWLSDRGLAVTYPGLESHPQHELAKSQLEDFGAVVVLDFNDKESMVSMLDRLRLIKVTGSLGSTETLVAPCHLFYSGDMTQSENKTAGLDKWALRFSIGLEHVDDIVGDIQRSFG